MPRVSAYSKVATLPRLPTRARDANKGDCGRVLIVGGSRGMAGAPCLAARGAYRGGAGLVRVVVPATIQDIVAAKLDECLVDGLKKTNSGVFSHMALRRLNDLQEWADVIVMGPGMTQAESAVRLVLRAVAAFDKPFVLDADALNAFAGARLKSLAAAQRRWLGRMLVLTPHPGEMARLLSCTPRDIQADRPKAALALAQRVNAVVVLKGAGTLVSDGKRLYENRTGNPGMATGGTGDVLAGLIGALIGQGMAAFDAACLGAHLHGLAGDLAARRLGMWSLMAGDVAEELPHAFVTYAEKHGAAARSA
jgi:NAD(P)H-hydrate epimerase